jgi:polar amino acid transport system permease protein
LADVTFVAQTLRASTLETAKIFTLVLLLYFAVAAAITALVRAAAWKAGSGWWQGKAA